MNGLPLKPYGKKKKKSSDIIFNAVLLLFFSAVIFILAFSVTFRTFYVTGDSMLDTLIGAASEYEPGGEFVMTYDREPERGEIVVASRYNSTTHKTYYVVKRVIALAGDRVYIKNGQLYLMKSGEEEFSLVVEDYVSEERNSTSINFPKTISGEADTRGHLVSEGCVFLLGDNRVNSTDSRSDDFGDISLEKVVGVVTQWSFKYNSIVTGWHTFWQFTLPSLFKRS